ncbi:MAG: sterol desaturase family protein [Alphaproteobacteria bacterium]|jgi:sterol desaturase/sphingolipid hydroxylase (fatty acid hydroxylase superfamily)|nr:sterol desaturase family protein [Alphaproteobacteria bacterium]
MDAPFDISLIITLAVPLFVVLIIAEAVAVRLGARGRYDAQDAAASLAMGLGNRVAGLLTVGIKLGVFLALSQFALFDIPWAWWSLVLCFLAEDLAYYWFHRTAHERRWFWASHVVHHSSQHYNLTTALRQTWTGDLSASFVFWAPLILIGFPVEMVLMFSAFSLVYQFFIHTETIDRLGPLEWVLNTPSHHRVHHATNPKYLDANYAGVLIVWDRLFGTFIQEEERPSYGIISNLGTLNPFRIAFHEWAGIARDLLSARSLREIGGYVFGPPGWSPDGSRKTSAQIKAAWKARRQVGTALEGRRS